MPCSTRPSLVAAALTVAGVAGLLASPPVAAQESGLQWNQPNFQDSYFALGSGGYFVADNTDDAGSGQATLTGKTGYGANVRFGATGYDLIRTEFELSYLRVPVADVDFTTAGGVTSSDNADGFLTAQTLTVGAYYDALTDGRFSPIVGANLGLGRTAIDIESDPGRTFDLDAAGVALAWGFVGGASYRVGERLELELLYRSRHTWQREFEATVGGSDDDYALSVQAHTVTLGLRYPFGADS